MLKIMLILLGTLSLVLGIIGVFVPGLPTTPFLLLTAGLYLRSSDRLYMAIMNHKVLGAYIRRFKAGGMDLKTKILSIFLMWSMILVSVFVFIKKGEINLFLLLTGVIGTLIMGFVIPTSKSEK